MLTNAQTTHSLKDLLVFPFRGKEWQSRFLIGVGVQLLWFIPFLPWIFQMGYFNRIMRRAIEGEELELPPWENWDKLIRDGLRLFGISLIYLLPSQIVLIGGMAAYFGGFFLLVPLMSSAGQAADAVAPLLMFALMGVLFLSMFLGYLLLLLGGIPLPVALARAVAQEKFSAGFQLGEIFKLLWRNKSSYFVAWVVIAGLAAIFYFVTMMLYMTMILAWILFIIGIPFGFYLMTIAAALFGQTYRESLAATGEPSQPLEVEPA